MYIRLAIYAIIFSAGVASAYFVLSPRIELLQKEYDDQVTLNNDLQSSLNEQNAKVHALGEESRLLMESSKNAIERAKKDNVVREHRSIQLMALKPTSIDLCKDASQLIDKELMQ